MGLAKKRRYDMSSRAAAAAHTRERILEAAYQLFCTEPFDDVTLARIGAHAGVSPQTVVLHFRTKDGLIEAIGPWRKPQEEALREVPGGDPREAARRICARYEELGAATMRMLALEDRVPSVRPTLEAGRVGHRLWVERTFGARLGTGAPRRRRIMALVAAYDLFTWHVLRRELDPEDTIEAMADLARGILDRKGARR